MARNSTRSGRSGPAGAGEGLAGVAGVVPEVPEGGQGGGGGEMYVINVESGQLTRVPRANMSGVHPERLSTVAPRSSHRHDVTRPSDPVTSKCSHE